MFLTRIDCCSMFDFCSTSFLQERNLPFFGILFVMQALTATGVVWMQCVYSLLKTLWVFPTQVLRVDHSCQSAVASLNAHRFAYSENKCLSETNDYCQARKRHTDIQRSSFHSWLDLLEEKLADHAASDGLWKDCCVYLFDGS